MNGCVTEMHVFCHKSFLMKIVNIRNIGQTDEDIYTS